MKTAIVLAALIVAGCTSHQTYEIDFSQAEGFVWDGKIRVIEAREQRLGPCLAIDTYRYVDRIELAACDGRNASISMDRSGSPPTAMIAPDPPHELQVFGTSGIWHGSNIVLIAEPKVIEKLHGIAASQLAEAMPPDRQKAQPTMTVRTPSPEMRPYAEHADEMTLTDWWAIALGESTEVTLEFDVPAENLKIRMRGNPREFGPATLQVRTNEGQLIRQFEQQQISVEKLNPDTEQKVEGAAP